MEKTGEQKASEILTWADINGARVYPEHSPVPNSNEISTVWICCTDDVIGYGTTFSWAIHDAMKDADDPTKSTEFTDFYGENSKA